MHRVVLDSFGDQSRDLKVLGLPPLPEIGRTRAQRDTCYSSRVPCMHRTRKELKTSGPSAQADSQNERTKALKTTQVLQSISPKGHPPLPLLLKAICHPATSE